MSATASATTDVTGFFGGNGSFFGGFTGRFPIVGNVGNSGAAPQPTGDILLVDNTSFILQVDNSSLICRAGGC